MSSIYLRKDGRWEARISLGSVNGKRQSRSFYGRTKEQAEEKLFGSYTFKISSGITNLTVKELCEEWLAVCSQRVKISTLANYKMKIKKHIIPRFGDIMCCEITSKSLYIFMQDKLNVGLSPRYVTDIMVLLKSMFKYACREYGIADPFGNVVMPKCSKAKVRLLTGTEQKKLRNYLKKQNAPISLGVTLALAMGLRVGEVCGLVWDDIDFEKRILTVKRTVQRIPLNIDNKNRKTAVIVSSPKSENSAREIPIPAEVFIMLKRFRSAPEHFILSNSTVPVEPRKMQYRFSKMLKTLDLPMVRFHSLRHCFASKAIEQGFDIKTLSEILGHSRIELTMNLYVHSDMERKRKCMELMRWSA